MVYLASCRMDIGRVRKNNEDNIYFDGSFIPPSEMDRPYFNKAVNDAGTGVFAVFDGMGGESYGEYASSTAAATLREYDRQIRQVPLTAMNGLVNSYTKDANNMICRKMDETNTRIGSTYAILCIRDNKALAYNVGDSRIYFMRDCSLRQITEDHNTQTQMSKLGLTLNKEKDTSASRNMLTQHLGIYEDEMAIEPFASPPIELRPGDFFLLCSDGLTGIINDIEIDRILRENCSVDMKVNNLVEKALANGGKDNISVILISIGEDDKTANKTHVLAKKANKTPYIGWLSKLKNKNIK